MLEFFIVKNMLTDDPNKYRAQIVSTQSCTFEDITNYLLNHNTGLSKTMILGVWEGIKSAVQDFVSDGKSVNTELFATKVSIRGVFNGLDDLFEKDRHEIRINTRPGPLLRNTAKMLKAKKVSPRDKFNVFHITDIKTGSVDSRLTPGKNIRVTGKGLKISGDNPSCGIYFISEKNEEKVVKIEPSDLIMNNPSELILAVPNLCKGIWYIKLVTQYYCGQKFTKTPRTMTNKESFTVA